MESFEVIRIIFWMYVLFIFMRLLYCNHSEKGYTLAKLNLIYAIDIVILVAYVVYASQFAKASTTPIVFNWIGYFLVFSIIWVNRRVYLPKIIKRGKIYEMTNLRIRRSSAEKLCRVYGTIKEGKHTFDVVMYLSKEEFMVYDAKGMFDKAAQNSAFQVKLLSRIVDHDTIALAEVEKV